MLLCSTFKRVAFPTRYAASIQIYLSLTLGCVHQAVSAKAPSLPSDGNNDYMYGKASRCVLMLLWAACPVPTRSFGGVSE